MSGVRWHRSAALALLTIVTLPLRAGAPAESTAVAPEAATSSAPLWELGLGTGVLAFADYRGADTGQVYPIPVPYVIYRGRRVQANRDGVHGLLLRERHVELKVSLGATTPVRRSTALTRRGMPGLHSTIEFGPSFEWHAWQSSDARVRLDLRLPATLAVTAEATPKRVGWQFTPRLAVDIADVGGHRGWKLGVLAGPLYGDRDYHQYFYGVATGYATALRPAYTARGGYGGAQVVVALTRRYPRYWVGAFARHDWLAGAVFADSPLVRSHGYWMAGAGIAWLLGESARHAASDAQWQP